MIIEGIDIQFGKVDRVAGQRIEKLESFKEVVSKKVITFLEEMEKFKELFTTFAEDQQHKLQNLPVFKKGVDFYQSQLNFKFVGIL
jgi:hypothetical protein